MTEQNRDILDELRGPQPDECPACLADGVKAVRCGRGDCAWTEDVRRRAASEIEDLRVSLVAFGGPYAVQYARERGMPEGHLHPVHYDILLRAGARMDDFVRGDVS